MMNNKMSFFFLILIIAPLFCGYRSPVATERENSASAAFVSSGNVRTVKYVIDPKESVVKWKCSYAIVDKGGHNGFVSLSKGDLMIEKGQLKGGAVEVDMNTITDALHRDDNNLINHLKDVDFFDVRKFPLSTFAITKVAEAEGGNVNVTGNLTVKGITHEVTFPAQVDIDGGTVIANGKMTIDRTQWDVRHRSGKFYDNLADRAISDDIEFDMKIVAKK